MPRKNPPQDPPQDVPQDVAAAPAPRGHADEIPVWCRYDELVDPAALTGNPRNPNLHSQQQLHMLARVIFGTDFRGADGAGWRHPIVVSTRSGYVVKGHGRLGAALLAGRTEVPIERQHYANEAAEHADMMADHHLAELSETDDVRLAELLQELTADETFDLTLTGYSSDELSTLLDQLNPAPPTPPDQFQEFDSTITTDYRCPKCNYEWSGKAK